LKSMRRNDKSCITGSGAGAGAVTVGTFLTILNFLMCAISLCFTLPLFFYFNFIPVFMGSYKIESLSFALFYLNTHNYSTNELGCLLPTSSIIILHLSMYGLRSCFTIGFTQTSGFTHSFMPLFRWITACYLLR
jgi:hypothetical protein